MEESISDKPYQVALRPAEADDAPFLFELYASTRADEMAAWGWDAAQQEAFLRMQFIAKQRSYEMQYGEVDHDIILFNDERAGRMIVNRTGPEILFLDIALLPQYRNRGIGTSVIKGLFAEAVSKDTLVRIHLLKSNTEALRLYRRLGFYFTGESDIYHEMEWRPNVP